MITDMKVIKRKKEIIENKIRDMITEFNQETGLDIKDITINKDVHSVGCGEFIVYNNVSLKVEL